MKHRLLFVFLSCALTALGQHVPTFEEVISLRTAGGVTMSPDGKSIVFGISTTDWSDNRYDNELWISRNGEAPYALTNTPKGNSTNAEFSPDGKWVAFLSNRGNKNQIHVVRVDGGEARAATNDEEGISAFQWHPSGSKFIFQKSEKEDKTKKDREKRYGGFEADDKEFTVQHLWQVEFNPNQRDPSEMPCYETSDSLKVKAGCIEWPKASRLTEGKFTVTGFSISPDGNMVAFSHQPDPMINSFIKSDVSMVDLSTKAVTKLVTNPSSDFFEDWSPDSKEILYSTNGSDTVANFYTNSKVYILNLASKSSRQIAKSFDEDLGGLTWKASGIFTAVQTKTKRPLYRIDPSTGNHTVFLQTPEQIFGLAFSKSGDRLAMTARNGDQLTEVFTTSITNPNPVRVTDMTAQIKDWKVATSEVISWKSKDGAVIEGVLHKPSNYDPARKYPLLVVIHGGPTGIDTPAPLPGSVYPIAQWVDKGALVLRVNYRGSAGYGEAFRALNVRNLGVGDAWDVLSGVDYLDSKKMIDRSKMGCMGWSQGGYISAFLTTNSTIFKAISVGAGISNWMTYYVNTDIHPFTRQYLKATPWSDEAIYKKTSPMTNINMAKTPTLIQHGEFDRRVPIANAYELLQGLRDKGVPSELIVYKGFGHGINKPKERLAANWHNWQWFGKYVWGETMELPLGK
ncbi:MAG: S9 family peptidase [Cyclobacteriaceae bacterium]|nr:S9 family peptidase [Cyclobacteriaceae bacterium]